MNYKNIINIIFGIVCIIIAIWGFNSLVDAKDDTDLALILITSICSSAAGACFIATGIADWNKSN